MLKGIIVSLVIIVSAVFAAETQPAFSSVIALEKAQSQQMQAFTCTSIKRFSFDRNADLLAEYLVEKSVQSGKGYFANPLSRALWYEKNKNC